jgi:hypothetical protein
MDKMDMVKAIAAFRRRVLNILLKNIKFFA